MMPSLLCFVLLALWGDPISLEPIGQIRLDIPEPSDLCFSSDGQCIFIVSDKGRLFEVDLEGEILKRAKYKSADFEAVCVVDAHVFVVDETMRRIVVFDEAKIKMKQTRQYVYSGAMNRGWESFVYDPENDRFIAFTEKLPLLAFEFDRNLNQTEIMEVEGVREISGATYHGGYIWAVSDEDRTVYALSPKSLKVKMSYSVPVLNPEGITFTPDGNEMWLISDDLHRIYRFKSPLN